MTLAVYTTNAWQFTGYCLRTDAAGQGQFNIYEEIQADITPAIIAKANSYLPTRVTGWGIVKGYMISRVTNYDPLLLSKFGGYPQRFNLGSFRYLQANRAIGKPRYIDCLQWADSEFTRFFCLPITDTNYSFPPDTPVPATEFSGVNVLSNNYAGIRVDAGMNSADGFSFDLNSGVVMDFAFLYYCFAFYANDDIYPLDVISVNL